LKNRLILIWNLLRAVQIRATARRKGMLCTRELAAVAQMVEHVIRNDGVGGSSPFSGTTKPKILPRNISLFGNRGLRYVPATGIMHRLTR
jgi:hypothetical protein